MKHTRLIENGRTFELRDYNREVLELSLNWLNDPDIQAGMRITYTVTKEGQEQWFSKLPYRDDYKIWAFYCDGTPIGAGGFRNITSDSGELTCYVGDKNYWGTGKYLVSLLLQKACELNFSSVSLKVLHTNERAYHCYIKRGFEYVEEDDLFKKLKIKIK